MFNLNLFLDEMPVLGGIIALVFIFFIVVGAIGAICGGGNLRFIIAGLVMTGVIGVLGLLLLAANAWQITNNIVENYVDWFNFPPSFWGRMGVIAVLAIPTMIAGIPLCLVEGRLLNWAARG